jgi:hypothetical protein
LLRLIAGRLLVADGLVRREKDEARFISGITLDIAAGGNAYYTA